MKNILLFLGALMVSSIAFAKWNLNDVSFLMPLPQQVGNDHLLRLNSSGKGGPLVPGNIYAQLPTLSMQMNREEAAKSLRLLAVRLDPCFPLPVPQQCQRQVRLVWQPIIETRRGQTQTLDAAVHSFYNLSDSEFQSFLGYVQKWKAKYNVQTQGLPLQVHPVWAGQRDASPALSDFQQILLTYLGQENLSRVTVMVLRGAGDMWGFAGVNIQNGKADNFQIPRITKQGQAYINQAIPADHFENAQINPVPKGNDTFNTLMTDSQALSQGNEDLIRKEMNAVYRIENPKIYNSENMDCVSCHVTQAARLWTLNQRKDVSLLNNMEYGNPRHNLRNASTSLGHTQNLRGFGYFGAETAISQRVINESAEVADALEAYMKRF